MRVSARVYYKMANKMAMMISLLFLFLFLVVQIGCGESKNRTVRSRTYSNVSRNQQQKTATAKKIQSFVDQVRHSDLSNDSGVIGSAQTLSANFYNPLSDTMLAQARKSWDGVRIQIEPIKENHFTVFHFQLSDSDGLLLQATGRVEGEEIRFNVKTSPTAKQDRDFWPTSDLDDNTGLENNTELGYRDSVGGTQSAALEAKRRQQYLARQGAARQGAGSRKGLELSGYCLDRGCTGILMVVSAEGAGEVLPIFVRNKLFESKAERGESRSIKVPKSIKELWDQQMAARSKPKTAPVDTTDKTDEKSSPEDADEANVAGIYPIRWFAYIDLLSLSGSGLLRSQAAGSEALKVSLPIDAGGGEGDVELQLP